MLVGREIVGRENRIAALGSIPVLRVIPVLTKHELMHRVCNLFDSHAVSFIAVLSTARYSCLPPQSVAYLTVHASQTLSNLFPALDCHE